MIDYLHHLCFKILIFLRALALKTLMSLKVLVFGDLLNLDRACYNFPRFFFNKLKHLRSSISHRKFKLI